jgi:cellulose synthase/poly-beta-1,6-N-acetylglucosamine synthase-like glycosyltransferase
MGVLITILQVLVLVYEALLAVLVAYLLLLTASAMVGVWRARQAKPLGNSRTRFLILIPAHNEEKLLPDLLANLRALDYPEKRYQIHVVADNCSDNTAELARRGGAVAHERTNLEQRGKGYALQWLLGQIWTAAIPYDAVVILDADSIVSPDFLAVMDGRLARGERAIQAYYAVRDPDRSWSVALRYAALAVLHYLRPLGRMALGGSVGLKGNGMVFAANIVRRYPWSASLTEDIEYHMALVLGGERVTFAHDAVVWAEMPGTLADSQSQNVRWERGRLEMVRSYVPKLLAAAWGALRTKRGKRAYVLFDAAMEQIIPPFSILAGASVLGLFLALFLGAAAALAAGRLAWQLSGGVTWAGVGLGLGLLLGQAIYTLAGLRLAAAPRRVYLALLAAPAMIAWKIWLYARVLLGLDRQGWVRTKRNT